MTITLNGTTGITLPNGSASAPAATGSDTDTGIVYGTNTVQIATGGTTAATVDSSQNVGIGTSSPSAVLDVVTSSSANGVSVRGRSSDNISDISLKTNDASSVYGQIQGRSTDLRIQSNSTLPITFYTNSNERARIDSSGNLLVGSNSTGVENGNYFKMEVSNRYMRFGHSGTGNGTDFVKFDYNGTQTGGINQNSTASVAYVTTSDYRLKENIAPMTGALEKVAQLKPCTYTWKIDGSDGQGFIAHELQAVVPDCVTGEKDWVDADGNPVYQGIDTSFLVATLTAAIQELKAELDTVKTELATLKGTA